MFLIVESLATSLTGSSRVTRQASGGSDLTIIEVSRSHWSVGSIISANESKSREASTGIFLQSSGKM